MDPALDAEAKAIGAAMMIRSTPQPVRARLLADHPFTEEMGVGVTTTMQLGPAISITADRFVDAIKAALGGAATVEATPESGDPIRFEATLTGTTLTLASKDLTIDHPFVTVFSPEREARLQAAQAFSADVLVASERAEHWRRILAERALTPLEYTDLVRDARATPEALLERLRDSRHLNPESMVPTEPGYWSSLLPMAAPDQDFAAFINGPLHAHHRDMLELNPQLALSRIGHTSAARAVIPFELLQKVNPQDLETTLANEDPLSLLFAFEVAANRLQDGAAWESLGTRALDKLFGDKDATNRRCELLSATIVISFARLRRVREWRAAPLFWRRLAALTQASVLANTLSVMPKPAPFRQWAFKNLGADYYWQTLTDRREGPSWWPQVMEPHALKAWTAARFLRAMETIDESRWPAAWRAAAEGIRADTLDDRERAMMAFPAPLDDFMGYERTLDANLFGRTIEALRDKPCRIPGLDPFIYLAKLTDEHLALLRDYVARTSLPTGDDAGIYVTELTVIAHAAGTCRNVALANALAEKAMVLFKPATEDQREMVISLLVDAASAYADEDAHPTWLAQWLERLAYTSSSNSEIDLLRSVVQSLIAVNPRYRPYLSRARAVLEIKSEQPTATAG